jgi:hypothetical protein
MLLVLFTLEDFIRAGSCRARESSPPADCTWKTQRGRYKAFRGPKSGRRHEPVEVLQSGHLADGGDVLKCSQARVKEAFLLEMLDVGPRVAERKSGRLS